MIANISRNWWLVALRGALGILFGICAFVWPGITLVFLVAFLGAYLFVDGVVAVWLAIKFRHERERWPMLLLEGILGIAVGVVTFFYPRIAALAWVYTIAIWAIATGILEISLAIRLRREIEGEWLVILTGVLSIVFGVLMAALPVAGLLVWVWLTGGYAIVFGILMIAFAVRLRKLGSSTATPTGFSAAGRT
jgi:uncharacterized membrane protein HdeD (DUF308 family)